MCVNKYKINLSKISSGVTATTVNIPINLEFQLVDNAELIDRVFVQTEVENAINEILDYDKVRYMPITNSGIPINAIIYDLKLLNSNGSYVNFYGDVGYEYDDVKYSKNSFTNSFLRLSFYDSDNPMIQNLVGYTTLFSRLSTIDLLSGSTTSSLGLPKPINQIPLNFTVENPLINKRGFSEGFHLYYYRDGLKIGDTKYLYMKASYNNAKSGKLVNLMVKNTPQNIENLVHEIYTRYKISRTTTGYFYEIDDTYQGLSSLSGASNNVQNVNNTVNVSLYQVNAI